MGQTVKHVILSLGFKANADMSSTAAGPGPNTSFQYTFVKANATAFTCDKAGAGDHILGVCDNQPKLNSAAEVVLSGISQLIVDGSGTAIAAGDRLKSDASGRGIKTVTNLDEAGAIALEPSTAQNDQIAVIVLGGGIQIAHS